MAIRRFTIIASAIIALLVVPDVIEDGNIANGAVLAFCIVAFLLAVFAPFKGETKPVPMAKRVGPPDHTHLPKRA